MTETRIYKITDHDAETPEQWLVEAPTRAQALRAVVKDRYTVVPAKPIEVAKMLGQGATLIQAGGDDAAD